MVAELRPARRVFQLSWNHYIQSTTRNQYTKDFDHLKQHKQPPKIPPEVLPMQKHALRDAARPEDRIKWWNIVPGDRVKLRGDKTNTVHEVYSINRVANHVFLRGIKANPDVQDLKPFPYSQIQLFIDHFELPPRAGEEKPRVVPVFARRIATSTPKWVNDKWEWSRFASCTEPKLPKTAVDAKTRVEIPWPEALPELKTPASSIYDTSEAEARKVTWRPPNPKLRPLTDTSIPSRYLAALAKSTPDPLEEALPVEHYLAAELSNPHSRTKKQRRWQAQKAALIQLRKDILQAELSNLDGRTRRDVRAEAEYRFRTQVQTDQKAEGLRRRVQRGELAQVARRRIRRARKEARRIRNLRDTKLHDEANQVLPGAAQAVADGILL